MSEESTKPVNPMHGQMLGVLLGICTLAAIVVAISSARRPTPRQQLTSLIQTHDANAVRAFLETHRNLVDDDSLEGLTPLQEAIMVEDVTLIKIMLEFDSDVNNPGSGESPLSTAVLTGNLAVVAYLIDHDAELNDDHGASSSLLLAETMKYYDIVELLKRRGAKSSRR